MKLNFKISYKNLNSTFSTLNFVLCFVGYPLATSLFLPVSSDIEGISRSVTIPYRAFALMISIFVIAININKSPSKVPLAFKVFIFFWAILIFRIFYDLHFRLDVHLKDPGQLWLYIFGICLPAVFSILKSYRYINLGKALYWIYLLSILTLILTLFSNQLIFIDTTEVQGRQNANIALNTIIFGHIGTSVVLVSIFLLLKTSITTKIKIGIVLILIMATFVMLRAGSRGPLVALIIVLLFWTFSFKRNILTGATIIFVTSLVTFLFINSILELIGSISPIIASRMEMTLYENDLSDRQWFYGKAIEAFYDSPIWGKQFAIFRSNGEFSYSHNIVLDALMGLGIIGGSLIMYFLYKALTKAYTIIKIRDNHYWISLIFIQQFIFSMTSGAIYHDQQFSALLTFIFLYKIQIKDLISSSPEQVKI